MTKPDKVVYVTCVDARTRKSKTITLYGLTVHQVLAALKSSIARP